MILTKKIGQDLDDTIVALSGEDNMCEEISTLRNTLDSMNSESQNKEKHSAIIQIEGEIKKLEEGYKKISVSLSKWHEENSQNEFLPKINIKSEIELIKSFSARITNFYNNYLNEQIDHFNGSLSIEPSINFNVEQVAYYKTFEKEVNEIINLLDNLLVDINMNKKDISKERLEHLKKLYTMESERKVHQMTSQRMIKMGKMMR